MIKLFVQPTLFKAAYCLLVTTNEPSEWSSLTSAGFVSCDSATKLLRLTNPIITTHLLYP